MARNNLHQITARLDRVFEAADKVDDDEIKSHLARYLCVLTSGYLEESVKMLITNYVAAKAAPFVMNHINSTTNNIMNLNSTKIGQFLNSFSNGWKDEFDNCLSDEEKDAIDSVVANRHLIAHGGNVGVSYVRIKEWHKNIKHVIEKIGLIIH
jgi:hypothetical protein